MLSIRVLSRRQEWDNFILKHNAVSFFQAWTWGEIEKSRNKSIWRIGIYNNSTLVLVSQIVKIEARRGTYLHVRNGPVYSIWDDMVIQKWIQWVSRLACEQKACALRISPLIKPQNSSKWRQYGFIPSCVHSMDGETVTRIAITHSDETLLMNMKKNTRNLIRKANKMNIDIIKTDDINLFLELYAKTFKRHGFIPHTAIREEYDLFKKDNAVDLLVARHEGIFLAGSIVVYDKNQAIYHHGASIRSNIPASYALLWKTIKRAKTRGLLYYNMFGISDDNKPKHPWAGLTQFKLGFGGEKIHYMHAHDLPLNFKYKILRTIEKYEKWRRGY